MLPATRYPPTAICTMSQIRNLPGGVMEKYDRCMVRFSSASIATDLSSESRWYPQGYVLRSTTCVSRFTFSEIFGCFDPLATLTQEPPGPTRDRWIYQPMQNSSAYDGLGSTSQFRGEGREG